MYSLSFTALVLVENNSQLPLNIVIEFSPSLATIL